jgi:hypothetical protein
MLHKPQRPVPALAIVLLGGCVAASAAAAQAPRHVAVRFRFD